MKNPVILVLMCCLFSYGWAQKKNYDIGILLDHRSKSLDSLLLILQDQIKDVVGEDATIRFPGDKILVNEYDLGNAGANYWQLVEDDVDIILAFGGVNHKYISELGNHVKPTILFGAISKDILDIDFLDGTSGIENFYTLMEPQSYYEDLKKLKELTSFTTVGIAVERPLVAVLGLETAFQKLVEPLGATAVMVPFDEPGDLMQGVEGLDALYLIGGFSFDKKTVRNLADVFIERGVPTLTLNGRAQVEDGLLATRQPKNNIELLIRRLALSIEQYINGTSLSDLPIWLDYETNLTLNFNTAEALGIPIQLGLVNDTDFVGKLEKLPAEITYGLGEIISGVLDKNLELHTIERDVKLSTQDVKLAKSEYLPSIVAGGNTSKTDPDVAAVSFGQSPEYQTSGAITMDQTLYSEAVNANISIGKHLRNAAQEDLNATELNTVMEAAITYFNTLIAKTNLHLQLQNLESTKKNYQIALENFEEGQNGKSDVLRFRSEIAQNTQQMVEASNGLDQWFIQLNQLLNNPIETKIDIKAVRIDDELLSTYDYKTFIKFFDNPRTREGFIDFLVQESKRNAPELKSIVHNMKAVDRAIRLNGRGRLMPNLSLRAQYGHVFDRGGEGTTGTDGFELPDDNYSVSINMSLPIFNRNRNHLQRQRGLIEKNRLEILRENTEQTIDANIRSAILNLVNEVSNIELSRVSEKAAEEALELTQTAYANGAVNSIQLIDAQNNLLGAQLQRATAVHTYLISALRVERLMGYSFLINDKQENTAFQQRFLKFLNSKN